MNYVQIGLIIGTETAYAARIRHGVSAFARQSGRPWLFALTSHVYPDFAAIKRCHPVGVIAYPMTQECGNKVAALGLPCVNVGLREVSIYPDIARVGSDNFAVGRVAAEHLIERRYRLFAFGGWPGVRFSDDREFGFVAAVKAAGFECSVYHGRTWTHTVGTTESPAEQADLQGWLAELPTPIGVYACNDIFAWRILQACRQIDRSVPEEIAIVGTDNDEGWCLLAHPQLSSVQLAPERVGYLAAAQLATILDGETPEEFTPVYPHGVVARQSSDTVAIDDELVADAVRFIREHAHVPISIPDLLKNIPISRRRLERLFQKELGRSPLDQIRQAHLRRAQELLAGTDLPIAEVSNLSGFSEPKHLSAIFHKHIGQTPSEYRAQFRKRI